MTARLFVIPQLGASAAARQLALLARHLPCGAARVCVLQGESAAARRLRRAGVAVQTLGWRRAVDVRPLWRLRGQIAAGGRVHAWGVAALWAVTLAGARPGGVACWYSPAGRLAWPSRQLLRRCGRVVVGGAADADVCRRLGVAADRLAVVPPAVDVDDVPAPADLPGVSPAARVVVCVGPIEPHKGFREAVWALDILRCVYDDLHLVLVGGGSDEGRIRTFARHTRLSEFVHITGEVDDVRPWLARAAVVWVPSLRDGGRGAALEAMAAGRPLVASRLPGLAELVGDGGLLVPPGDKVELARQTRALLEHPEDAARLGAAARGRAAGRFTVAATLDAFGSVSPLSVGERGWG